MVPSLPIHEHGVMNIIILLNSAKVLVKGRFCEKIVCADSLTFFYIILFWYHFSIYRLMSSGGKEQQPKKPVCSCLNVGHFQGEDKGSTWFLKSPKGPSKNSAWLVDAKAKGLPFNS